jgi:hypothetical protein
MIFQDATTGFNVLFCIFQRGVINEEARRTKPPAGCRSARNFIIPDHWPQGAQPIKKGLSVLSGQP